MVGTAVVIGGGPGGLAAAVGLHRTGWQVAVLEQAPSLEPVGAAISLWPNALRALDALGVGARIRQEAAVSGPGGIRRPDGRWLARNDVGAAVARRFGDPLVLLHRAELADALAAALPSGAVRTGSAASLASAGDGTSQAVVTVGGQTLSADLVVAADGVRSTTRTVLFPAAGLRDAGYSAWRGVCTVPPAPQVDGASETWGRNGQRFAIVPFGSRIYFYATVADGRRPIAPDPVISLERLLTLFVGWHAPIPQLLAQLKPSQILDHDIAELAAPLPSFVRGRVALLGDASHAMTPDLGQGGCQAIEDAAVLAASLRSGDIFDGLARYDAARRPRTTEIAARSRRAGRLSLAPLPVQYLAARVMGRLPENVLLRMPAPVVDWRPPRED